MRQEQAKKKATKLPVGDKETVNRLKQENKQLRSQRSAQSKCSRCYKCVLLRCDKGKDCSAIGKRCNRRGEADHFAASKSCRQKTKPKDKKVDTTRKLDDAADSGSGKSDESCGRILESSRVAKVHEDEKGQQESIHCQLWIMNSSDNDFSSKIRLATDAGVRKAILCRLNWEKICHKCQ